MADPKRVLGILYRNAGLICFVLGVASLVFGMFNLGALPHFYEAHSGDPGFDGTMTLYINIILWVLICLFLVLSGEVLYLTRKNIMKLDLDKRGPDAVYFYLVGAGILLGNTVYLILILMGLVSPIQFLPNGLFAGEETPMDLSVFFNGLLFYLYISLFYRIGGKFIKYGIKMGDSK
ncbi:MAG: hypothetical protein LUQ65_14490 [Candidatus Helarchaeota archaeon]|nr:hypothetical protein [Candidatus Helarchaeota archaeon]